MSDLEALCEALAAVDGEILRMAQELYAKAQTYGRASANAAAAARSAEGEAAAALGRTCAALNAAAQHCAQAALALTGASHEGRAYVQRTVGANSVGGSRGISSGVGATVLEDGTSLTPNAASEREQVINVRDAFINAHDSLTGRFDPVRFMALVNPNFEGYVGRVGEQPHNINCGLCAQAVALALDGRPHIAGGAAHAVSVSEMARWAGVKQAVHTPDSIGARLKSMPPGSHAIVGVDYRTGGGHWFNAYYDGETVWALDGQTGSCMRWPPKMLPIDKWDAIFTEGGVMKWET